MKILDDLCLLDGSELFYAADIAGDKLQNHIANE